MEACWPPDDSQPPPLADEARYPSVDEPEKMYGLDEGTGIWAFILVAAEQPLPAFRDWLVAREPPRWKSTPGVAGTVWSLTGDDLLPLTLDDPTGTRGKGRVQSGTETLAELLRWAKSGLSITFVEGRAFAVAPRM